MTQPSCPGVLDGDRQARWEIVQEEVTFLVEGGVRDPDLLARKLGFASSQAMERFLYRYALPIPYKSQQGYQPVTIRTDARRYVHDAPQNPSAQLVAAAGTVRRHERERPGAVPELLAMLGLPMEQQLDL